MGKRREQRKKGSGAKGRLLQVRLDDREKETFEAAADLSGIGLSSWVRQQLRRAAIRELEDAGRTIPLFRDNDDGEQK